MKKISKVLPALALSAALALGAAGAAFAADSKVTFESRGEVFSFAPGSKWTATDLFDGFKGVMPGDERTETVAVTNGSQETVKVYLHADPHDGGNALSDSVAAKESLESMREFLSVFDMRVYNGDELIYEGTPDSASSGLESAVLLGELAPGEGVTLKVELEADIDKMTNEHANHVGEVDWVFTVEEVPELLPDTGLSQTGDDMPVMLLGGIAIAAVLLVLVAARRRSQQ